jgi:hypothetical protein
MSALDCDSQQVLEDLSETYFGNCLWCRPTSFCAFEHTGDKNLTKLDSPDEKVCHVRSMFATVDQGLIPFVDKVFPAGEYDTVLASLLDTLGTTRVNNSNLDEVFFANLF